MVPFNGCQFTIFLGFKDDTPTGRCDVLMNQSSNTFGTFSQLLKLQVKNKKMIVLNLLNLKKNSTSLDFTWGGSTFFFGVSEQQNCWTF